MGQHCLDISHQRCLITAIKSLLDQKLHTNLQKPIIEAKQHILTECLPKINQVLEDAHVADNTCSELTSKRVVTETKVTQIREELQRVSEDSMNILHHIDNINKNLMDMMTKINEIKSKPTTGPNLMDGNDIYTWKINLSVLLNDELVTIFSDPFQSSKWGYRMKISITTYVEEHKKHRFIQPAFVLLQGEYDGILRWPFCYPITFCLVDLTGSHKNVVKMIKPDSRSAIFARPLDTANMPYTFSDFYLLEKLTANGSNYVQDNNIFLQIHVDFSETGVNPFLSKNF